MYMCMQNCVMFSYYSLFSKNCENITKKPFKQLRIFFQILLLVEISINLASKLNKNAFKSQSGKILLIYQLCYNVE